MKKKRFSFTISGIIPCAISTIVIGSVFMFVYIRVQKDILTLENIVSTLELELASTTSAFIVRTNIVADDVSKIGQQTEKLSSTLSMAERNIESTKRGVAVVETRVGGFEEKVTEISGTVNTLEKLSKTDKELLQKYSKVYFLNEHFVPDRLVEIESKYLYSELKPMLIHALVWPRLKQMMDQAKSHGVALYVSSAYRAFDEQRSLKSLYTVVYGVGTANQFSADQGYSEHQLGTTLDFLTTGLGGALNGFDSTDAYTWLTANAYKYGFILSYPKNNAYYVFEPWHWRYVGVNLATYMHQNNKNFYDMEQREIDEYLVNIFD
jgi:zinc D-Ala-D-Ala carboxypeptidase